MKHKKVGYKLKRSLGLFELSLYGIGIILGAGIYALIGVGAGIAGNAIWLSFLIAAIIAAFTGLSYAELSSMYPKEAAEYNYTKNAFALRPLSFIIGWMMVVSSIVGAATVAFGFAGYFSHIFGGNIALIASVLVILLSVISCRGIKDSSNFNVVSTITEVSGLLIVVVVGIMFFSSSGLTIGLFETPNNAGISAILSATAIIFFAYMGFEDIVNVSEEAKNARRIVPKALIISIAASTILYILVSFSAINIMGWEKLSASKAPLTETVSSVVPYSDALFSFIALFATANTCLILLIVGSRILYGMSSDSSLPKLFSVVCKRGTPHYSIIFIGIISLAAISIGNIKSVALITDLNIFLIYFIVNASLIALRYKKPDAHRAFKTPFNIGRFPVLALFGLISSLFMLFYFEKEVIAIEIAVIMAGFALYMAFKQNGIQAKRAQQKQEF